MGSKSLRPKLPKFEEQKDDMGAYIERLKYLLEARVGERIHKQ